MRYFNDIGACNPEEHYMVDLTERLEIVKSMVDSGKYFVINRGRQYGKTTMIYALMRFLRGAYAVLSLDFQEIGSAEFETEERFVQAFSEMLIQASEYTGIPVPEEIRKQMMSICDADIPTIRLRGMFKVIKQWCTCSEKPLVLIIDEVDSAANNQVFLDFLAQLRVLYLKRSMGATFQSVILAGVYSVENLKRKLRPEEERKNNSPWNIAAPFDVVMEFSKLDIIGMLTEYEKDHHSGMDIETIAGLLFDYTGGYPYLVSHICKLMDEKKDKWNKEVFLDAIKRVTGEKNSLFRSLIDKAETYSELKNLFEQLLFRGEKTTYNELNPVIDLAEMFGFVKEREGRVEISNRIFEVVLYEYLLSRMETERKAVKHISDQDKNQFIKDGRLDMQMVLEKYVRYYHDINAGYQDKFSENEGTRLFLLFLRPIINGTGNYYIEAQTRTTRRMDVVIDYLGEQFIVELKRWRGQKYHEEGERQLCGYLDDMHKKIGYMLIYNFNQKKKCGLQVVEIDGKQLIEATV